jgi:hypothetical protein
VVRAGLSLFCATGSWLASTSTIGFDSIPNWGSANGPQRRDNTGDTMRLCVVAMSPNA